MDNKPKKVYWDEISLDFNVKEKVEPGVPFILMGKKIFDCHHGKDRSIAMKKRAELRRIEVWPFRSWFVSQLYMMRKCMFFKKHFPHRKQTHVAFDKVK